MDLYMVSKAADLWARQGPGDAAYYARVIRDFAQKGVMLPSGQSGNGPTASNLFCLEEVVLGRLLHGLSMVVPTVGELRSVADSLRPEMPNACAAIHSGERLNLVMTFSGRYVVRVEPAGPVDNDDAALTVVVNLNRAIGSIVTNPYGEAWRIGPDAVKLASAVTHMPRLKAESA